MVRSCTILISVLVVTPTRDNISLFLRCGIFLTDLRFFERTCTRHIAVGVLEVCASSFCKIAGRFNIELSLCEGSALRGCVLTEHTPLDWCSIFQLRRSGLWFGRGQPSEVVFSQNTHLLTGRIVGTTSSPLIGRSEDGGIVEVGRRVGRKGFRGRSGWIVCNVWICSIRASKSPPSSVLSASWPRLFPAPLFWLSVREAELKISGVFRPSSSGLRLSSSLLLKMPKAGVLARGAGSLCACLPVDFRHLGKALIS